VAITRRLTVPGAGPVDAAISTGGSMTPPTAGGERVFDFGHGRSHELDARVAPRIPLLLGAALPVEREAQAGDVRHAAVDRDHLAVVAADPADDRRERRRVEGADLAAGGDERTEQAADRRQPGAEPVVDEPDLDAGAGLGGQQFDEPPAYRVVPDDVHLDVDRARRVDDGARPGGIVLGGVPQHAHAVAADERRAGRPAQRLIGQHAHVAQPLRPRGGPRRHQLRHAQLFYGLRTRSEGRRAP
jgi:hypothetical protein